MATKKTKKTMKKFELPNKVLFYVLMPKDLPPPTDEMVDHAVGVVKTLIEGFRARRPEVTEMELIMSVAVSSFLTAASLAIQALTEEELSRETETIQ